MNKIVLAKTKYANLTARKVRLVAGLIRNKKALEALDLLNFTSKKAAAEIVKKTLKSAIANATHNFGMNKKDLIITKVLVDDAPMFKRGRAISRGRYHQILKRNCHVVIGLTDNKPTEIDSEGEKSNKIEKVKKIEKKLDKKVGKKPVAKKAIIKKTIKSNK